MHRNELQIGVSIYL